MIVEVDNATMIVTKRAENGPEADRLRREAAVLDTARHPGITELLALDGREAGARLAGAAGGATAARSVALRVRAVPGRTLTHLSDLSDGHVAALGVALATTLADLHDLGIVHGAVAADHVLIDGAGLPVLCSLGRGGTARHGDRPDPAADVAGLAAMLEDKLARQPPGRSRDPLRRLLGHAAHRANRRRPSARRLAADLVDKVPGAALPIPWESPDAEWLEHGSRDGSPPRGHPTSPPVSAAVLTGRRRIRGLALIGLGLLLTVVLLLLRTSSGHRVQLPTRPAGVLTTGTGRYRIGRPTDQVVTGRWRCSEPLAALLRPATGEVWVFDAWASPEHPVPARLVARVPGAVSLMVDPPEAGAPGCDRLSVTRIGARPVGLDPTENAVTGTGGP